MPLEGEYAPSSSAWARKQAEEYEASDGAKANTLQGKPIIVLTNVGAKSGKLHKNAFMRVELQAGAEKHDYEAREVSGAERDLWWGRALEVWPAYAGYQKKTARLIPVFVLTRIVV